MVNVADKDGNNTGIPVRYGFLTYVSRSGSTLLGSLLSRHPALCVCTEANLPKELFGLAPYRTMRFSTEGELERYLSEIEGYSKLGTWELDLEGVVASSGALLPGLSGQKLVELLMEAYRVAYAPQSIVCLYKGSPAMPWDMPHLMDRFPGFSAVHLVRDPRAVHASQVRSVNPYTRDAFSSDPLDTAWQWSRAVSAVDRTRSQRLIELRFEDLVANPDASLERLAGFFRLSLGKKDPAAPSTQFAERLPEAERGIHRLADQAPRLERVDSWQHELGNEDILALETILRPQMRALAYRTSGTTVGPAQRLGVKLRWVLRRLQRLAGRAGRAACRILTGDTRYWRKAAASVRILPTGRRHRGSRP